MAQFSASLYQHLNQPSPLLSWDCGVLMKLVLHSEIVLSVIPVKYSSLRLTTVCLHVSSSVESATLNSCYLLGVSISAQGFLATGLSSPRTFLSVLC